MIRSVWVEVVKGGYIVRNGGANPNEEVSVHTDISATVDELRERLIRMSGGLIVEEAVGEDVLRKAGR